MTTPISDFVKRYGAGGASRLHMPGHKGKGPLGCEAMDITEIAGADSLYEAEGVIAASEKNAAALFGSQRTLYATEGSSQCIRAMLYLALTIAGGGARPVALAGRNAHKAFLYAAALCDFDVEWLYPESQVSSACACPLSPGALERALQRMESAPFCVYLTSPDYLGGRLDIGELARVCHQYGTALLVDNAHGAYLRFLPEPAHPMELGADLCCDSAHKTLPVLTGGAYLHIAQGADPRYAQGAKAALSLFGSTSPSYLILQSLDQANAALAGRFPAQLAQCRDRVSDLKRMLAGRGFEVSGDEPLKLTLETDGLAAAELLRRQGVECEYADRGHVVMMFAPGNTPMDFARVAKALARPLPFEKQTFDCPRPPRAMTIRQAMFSPSRTLPTAEAVGRVLAQPTVSCPPAVSIAVSGEVLTPQAVKVLLRQGIAQIRVVEER